MILVLIIWCAIGLTILEKKIEKMIDEENEWPKLTKWDLFVAMLFGPLMFFIDIKKKD